MKPSQRSGSRHCGWGVRLRRTASATLEAVGLSGWYLLAACGLLAQEVPYGVASWPEVGRGNHRALVSATNAAGAVRAHIPWRRRDPQPETKDMRIYDATCSRCRGASNWPS